LYRHYFALVAPALAVAAGAGLAWMREIHPGRTRAVVGLAILAVALPAATRPWYWLAPSPVAVSERMLGAQGFAAAPLVAAYLRERVRPDERIFVYGSEPEIPFLAGRRDVNPFGMVYPLTWTWPRHREFQERVWAGIVRWRPIYIVIARNPWSLVRSPSSDPFFEEHLTELAERAYRFEAALLAGPDGGLHFASARPETRPGESGERVVFELWRRTAEDGVP